LVERSDKLNALEEELKGLKAKNKAVVIGDTHQLCCDLETFLLGRAFSVCKLYTTNPDLRPTDLEHQTVRKQQLQAFHTKDANILVSTEAVALTQ
jgi:superfamily II DNA/RNA helicase